MTLGRRLSLLVVSELLTALFGGATAVIALDRLSSEYRYMHGYVFAPLVELDVAMQAGVDAAALVETGSPEAEARAYQVLGRVRRFLARYRREWQVAGSAQPEAQRFREALVLVDRSGLLEEERRAVDRLDAALARTGEQPTRADVAAIRAALLSLNAINIRYMQVAYDAYDARRAAMTTFFIAVGAVGIVLAPLLGLAARRAIVPRVERLVEKIERFREFGVNEPVEDNSGDELAVLEHTLDVGFAAILARDEERKKFLSIVAHELKTPLTTMKGFAQVALDHRDDRVLRDRALAVIDRQATRIARLGQDLLWVARAGEGTLPFKPGPLDFAALAQRMIGEAVLVAKNHQFPLTVHGDTHLLGDPTLLEHAVFSLLIQAASISHSNVDLPVTITSEAHRVRFTVEVPDSAALPDDLERLIEPFAVLQYEGRGEVRSTGLGLHLVREIAKLHGARLRMVPPTAGGVVFALELRR
ncbi:multi-sensor signal transduction histidine kinase [Minicystis rosea]|nr:multi-sensor signal transduction histidine kinase [Minicystis rosea]